MISVIFSTRSENPSYVSHIKNTAGINGIDVIEIINNGIYSLTEAYNKGLEKSKYEIVAFIHDDLILPNGWGKKILSHFNESEYGILGVAGTTNLPKSGKWWEDSTKMVGIVKHSHNGRTWENKYCSSYGKEIIEVCCLDGLFFVINKDKIKYSFDGGIKDFHFYDIDFTFKNHLEGVKVGVIFDVRVTHKSIGLTNEKWENNRELFSEKYKNNLPYNLNPKIRVENKNINLKNYPKLSIIIPTKGNIEMLLECINSLYEVDSYTNKIVYIADTGSTDEEKKQINEYISKFSDNRIIKLIEYDYYNFAKINNDVVEKYVDSDTELLLFCNNDIKLLNNGITQMVNIYTKNKNNVGTIGARLHFSDDTIQHAGMISWVSPKKSIEISHRGLRSYYNYEEFGEVIGNTGAFLMINKTLFKNLNGFNENYIECFEDVELNMKCIINNKKNYFVGSAVCYHYESISRGKSQEAINRLISDYKNNLLPFIINNKKIHKFIKGLNNN